MELERSFPYSQQPAPVPILSLINLNTVTCMSDSRRGFGLETGVIDHFNTRIVITLNYSVVADLHTLQITSAHAKSFKSAFTLH
jgi:hypothetical protein